MYVFTEKSIKTYIKCVTKTLQGTLQGIGLLMVIGQKSLLSRPIAMSVIFSTRPTLEQLESRPIGLSDSVKKTWSLVCSGDKTKKL